MKANEEKKPNDAGKSSNGITPGRIKKSGSTKTIKHNSTSAASIAINIIYLRVPVKITVRPYVLSLSFVVREVVKAIGIHHVGIAHPRY